MFFQKVYIKTEAIKINNNKNQGIYRVQSIRITKNYTVFLRKPLIKPE